MTLADQQLRQELIEYGETVPPITQRNREQLRARLDVLRSQKRPRIATASPSRTRPTASPSRARASVDSPSRTRATASPSRAATAGSPSRARASSTTATSTTSLTRTRSKQTPNLIELSDSDNEAASAGALKTRSAISTQATGNVQTRSNAPRRAQKSPTSLSPTGAASANMTNDVEESIARHRREIKQLLDSARDRNAVSTPGPSSLRSGHTRESPGKSSGHRHSPSPTSKSRSQRHSSKSDHESDGEDTAKRSSKSDHHGGKSSSSSRRGQKSCSSCCKTLGNFVKNLLKVLLVGSVLWAAGTFLLNQYEQTVPHREVITCSVKDATTCEDMRPVIAAVRKQLQVRTGEVDCGFRDKAHILVTRPEIDQYLNEKGLKFQAGDEERWRTLLTYIKDKPVSDITMWTAGDQPTNQTTVVQKLSTKEGERSLICRARQLPSKTLRNLAYVLLGSTGLLTVAWFLHKHTKSHEENENTFRDYLGRAVTLLKEQYEKHAHDHNTQPWLAIDYIRDKLIPEKDQERLQHIWERVKSEISKQDSRIRSELQEIDGKASDVWRWVKSAASPKKSKPSTIDESDPQSGSDVGLTQCLKLRNCFRSEDYADDDEIDHVVDSIQTRCASVKRIEHIGIHSVFVYLKFSSKEAAAQGYHLLNNWHYQDRTVNVKYIRLNRYYEHFPEAQDAGASNE